MRTVVLRRLQQNLIAFDKTEMLEPGASETITVSFDVEDMASYDSESAKAYVLEAGDYGISIRSDSHTILDEQTYHVDATAAYTEGRDSDEVAATNQFEDAEGDVTYLSRADGLQTMTRQQQLRLLIL